MSKIILPQEKAKELIQKYTNSIFDSGYNLSKHMIKQCALIAVDEILNMLLTVDDFSYWDEVKEEIEKI